METGLSRLANQRMHRLIQLLALAAAVLTGGAAYGGTVSVSACGALSQPATRYVLQNDVVSDGTCFFVNANDVTLDLNGHTVTYDNAAPIAVQNGSFESVDFTGWDKTGAPAAVIAAGAYLDRTVYDGGYALKIPAPLTQDQAVTTTGSYTLKANTAYTASVMVWQPYDSTKAANADIHMTIEILRASDGAVLAVRDSRDLQLGFTSRGFQYVRASYMPTIDTGVKLRLKVTGGRTVSNVGQAPYGAFYFDDVRIQQTGNSGIQFGGTNVQYGATSAWARRGAVDSTGTKGGVVQGRAHGDFSHAVYMNGGAPSDLLNYSVNNLEITVSGNSSRAIWISNVANIIVSNNLIHGYNDTIEIRDHYDGALIFVARADAATGVAGKIFNNTITHGIQTGIYVAGSPSATMLTEIYNNDITLQSKYTNDFAIVGGYGTYSAYIHDNTVRCGSGNDTCRGLFIHGSYGKIVHNTVEVHYRKNNQEYALEIGGCGGAAYGIQVDIASSNVETKLNNVTAYADECEAAAFRFYAQPPGSTVNNLVHDNTFQALATPQGSTLASALRILLCYPSDMTFTNNTLITNSNFLYLDGNVTEDANRGLSMDKNSFQISYPKSAIYFPLVDSAYLNGSYGVPKNVTLSNNIYGDDTVRADMTGVVFRNTRNSFLPDTFASNIVITSGALIVIPPNPRYTAPTHQ